MDTARAQETAAAVEAQMAELDQALQADIAKIESAFDPGSETLQEILIAPTPAGINPEFFGLVWLPYRRDAQGKAVPAWKATS
jgi:hypothetical protein